MSEPTKPMPDLRNEQELVEQCFKLRADGQITAEREDILSMLRSHTNALIGAAVEACAKQAKDMASEDMGEAKAYDYDSAIRSLFHAATGELERRIAEAIKDEAQNPWKQAIIEEQVLECGAIEQHDAKKALHQIICWNNQVALDPAVSKDAAKLAAEARLEELSVMLNHLLAQEWNIQDVRNHVDKRIAALTAAAKEKT